MPKMRIRHLLEMKSARDRKNLTLKHLSVATGIPHSVLSSLSTKRNAKPSREDLKQLKNYFKCKTDDLFDHTTKLSFDLSAAFPPDDKLSTAVLPLLAAAQDITFLQLMILRYENEISSGIRREIRNGEKTFTLYLALGFLNEGMNVFRRMLNGKTARLLCSKLESSSKDAFEILKQESCHQHDLLKNLRHGVSFHYNEQPYCNALQSIKQKKGHFIIGQTAAETRYLVADDVRSEILRSYIDFDSKDKTEKEKMSRIITLMGKFIEFSNGFLIAYLEHRKVKWEVV
jgi:putative transcriptional regulator